MAGSRHERLLQSVAQQAAIGQLREQVVKGQVVDFFRGGLALAQVEHGHQHALSQRHPLGFDRALTAVLAMDYVFGPCDDAVVQHGHMRELLPQFLVMGALGQVRVGMLPPGG